MPIGGWHERPDFLRIGKVANTGVWFHHEKRIAPPRDKTSEYHEKPPLVPRDLRFLDCACRDDELLAQEGVLGNELSRERTTSRSSPPTTDAGRAAVRMAASTCSAVRRATPSSHRTKASSTS